MSFRIPTHTALLAIVLLAQSAGCRKSPSVRNASELGSAATTGTIADVSALEARIAELTQSLTTAPQDAETHYIRGKNRYILSRYLIGGNRYAMQLAALDDFQKAHDLMGGDPLFDPQTQQVLSPSELEDWPVEPNGTLELFENVRRVSPGVFVRVEGPGVERRVGGPGHLEAMLQATIVAANLYNFPLAISYSKRAATIDAKNIRVRLYLAYFAAHLSGDWQRAITSIRLLSGEAETREFPKIWSMLGTCYAYSGRPDLAEKEYRKALAIKPTDLAARIGLALSLGHLNRPEEAIELNRAVLTDNPNDHFAAVNLASVLNSADRFAEARDICLKLVEREPTFPAAWINLGTACSQLGETEKALDAYNRALEFVPNNPDIHYDIGRVLSNAERYAEAEDAYLRALQLSPNYAAVHYNLGINYRDWLEYEKAVTQLQIYTRLAGNDWRGWQSLAYCLFMLDRYPDSEKAYQRAVTLRPQDGYSLSGLGFICERNDNDKRAASFHKMACLASDSPPRALADYKRVTFRNAWFEMVVKDMAQLSKSETWRTRALDLRTLANIALGKEDEALEDYSKLTKRLDPSIRGTLHFRTGVIHFLGNDDEAALAELDAALEWDEGNQYPALYKWLAQKRMHRDKDAQEALVRAVTHAEKDSSILRLLTFYLKDGDRSELVEAARSDSERCEAYYYIAQHLLLTGNDSEAADWLEKCRQTNAFNDLEYAYAYHAANKEKLRSGD